MQRKTINNEAEWVAYVAECVSNGYTWRGVEPYPESVPYPVQIITRPEANMYITWSTQLFSDIAETISNEAVYLEALEHVYDEVCSANREANAKDVGFIQKNNIYDESLAHIRNIIATALQVCHTSTGEVDMTQERAEDEMSYIGNTKLD